MKKNDTYMQIAYHCIKKYIKFKMNKEKKERVREKVEHIRRSKLQEIMLVLVAVNIIHTYVVMY